MNAESSNRRWVFLGLSSALFPRGMTYLTHWGPVTHVCASKLATTASDNGLSPGRRQVIIWTNAEILLIVYFHSRKCIWKNVVWEMPAILSRHQCVKPVQTNTVLICFVKVPSNSIEIKRKGSKLSALWLVYAMAKWYFEGTLPIYPQATT